jgi:group I intron endonuclease
MWKKVGIYKITSPTGRVYIGQSWDIGNRRCCYKTKPDNGQPKIYNSIRKYGFDNHTFEIIHELPKDVSQDVLDEYEILYITQYKECGFKMLNIKGGGSYGKHSQETKDKISKVNKGRIRNDNIIRNKNMIISEETRQKMKLAKLGNKNRLGGKKYLQNSTN